MKNIHDHADVVLKSRTAQQAHAHLLARLVSERAIADELPEKLEDMKEWWVDHLYTLTELIHSDIAENVVKRLEEEVPRLTQEVQQNIANDAFRDRSGPYYPLPFFHVQVYPDLGVSNLYIPAETPGIKQLVDDVNIGKYGADIQARLRLDTCGVAGSGMDVSTDVFITVEKTQ